jgi:hypothetical protein
LAGIFFEPENRVRAYKALSGYAEKYSMNVLMSNYTGQSWGLDAGGQSGFWDKNGNLIANLNDIDPGLLIIEKNNNNWIGSTLNKPD